MRSRVNWFVYVAVLVVLFAWLRLGGGSPKADDRDMMIGTWTDESGAPGNAVRFYYVAREIPGMEPVKALDGHATAVKWLGEVTAEARWIYVSWDPLVLNFTVGNQAWYVTLRKLDDDHILVRFGKDPEEMCRPEAIDHPETKRLTRIGREPAP